MSPTAFATTSPSRPLRVFGGHPLHTDGDLLVLAFAPGGVLWSIEEPGVLRLWDPARAQQVGWHALDELATVWAASPDGTLLAAASDELGVWQVRDGEQVIGWSLPGWCSAATFQPGGTLVATGHDDGTVSLWDRTTGRPVRSFSAHERPVSALAFSADGQRLASAGEDKAIHLWTLDGGKTGSLVGHKDRIPALVWHPDGKRIYSAGWDTTVRVWDVSTCEPVILLNSHATQVYALALSPDGRRLACADSASAVHLWDTSTHRSQAVLREQVGEIRTLAFSADGQRLAYGGADRVIHLWDAGKKAGDETPIDPLLSRTCLSVSPDGRRLASLGAGTVLRVWDVSTGRQVFELEGNPVLRAFAASPDGQWLAASRVEEVPDDRATLALYSATDGKRRVVLDGQRPPITTLAFSPDSRALASSGYQTSDVWLWEVPSGRPTLIVPAAADSCSVEALAWHPDGKLLGVAGIDWLATSGADGWVTLWDVAERRQVLGFQGGASALAFHPAGRLLAVASLVQKVRVYDVEEGKLLHELAGHLEPVTCVAFSPDGRWLASGGDDRTVRLWDAQTGEPVGVRELDTQIKAVCFSPDGALLFTGNGNTTCYQLGVQQLGG